MNGEIVASYIVSGAQLCGHKPCRRRTRIEFVWMDGSHGDAVPLCWQHRPHESAERPGTDSGPGTSNRNHHT